MEETTKTLISLLGEDNATKVKEAITKTLCNTLINDIEGYGMYYLDCQAVSDWIEDIVEECKEELKPIYKKKIKKKLKDALEKELEN